MTENTPIISFKDADILNGEATVIYGLNMDVYPGDFVYIVGKVGTGKTSIIRTIIAENRLEKGTGEACGFKLNGIKDNEIPFLRRKMGVVFQDFQLLMDRSVEENLQLFREMKAGKYAEGEKVLRAKIDIIDENILYALSSRMKISRQIGEYKKNSNVAILQTSRWDKVLAKVVQKGREYGLSEAFLTDVFNAIHEESVEIQNQVISGNQSE